MRIDYRLAGMGWAECEVEIEGVTETVHASYLSHALEKLIDAATSLVRGAAEGTVRWELEPGEARWRLTRVDPDRLRVRILFLDDISYDFPDERGTVLLDAECRLRAFAGAVLSAARRVLETYGMDGYRELWHLADFPLEPMRALESALRARPDLGGRAERAGDRLGRGPASAQTRSLPRDPFGGT